MKVWSIGSRLNGIAVKLGSPAVGDVAILSAQLVQAILGTEHAC